MRRDAREAVYRMIYSYLLTGEVDGELKNYYYFEHKLNGKDVEFADTLLSAVLENEDKILKKIEGLPKGYSLDRINQLDKAAILIAATEIDNFPDIDDIVSIDEATRLTEKYSTENSPAFVNGILAGYMRLNDER